MGGKKKTRHNPTKVIHDMKLELTFYPEAIHDDMDTFIIPLYMVDLFLQVVAELQNQMGHSICKTLLVGRNTFKTSKLKISLKLTLSRLCILKNKHLCRLSNAKSDVAQLLSFGYRDQAIDRAEHVIKEQNMLAVFDMVESYCNFLIDRLLILQSCKACPEELADAISSLIYASSRIGELPELLDVRSMFAVRFGHAFVSAAVSSNKDFDERAKAVMKLTSGNKWNVTRVIAEEKGLTFDAPINTATSSSVPYTPPSSHNNSTTTSRISSTKPSLSFTDPVTAALTASYAAEYAASAARTAVTLSNKGKEIPSNDGSDNI